jgi:hypothetical protein
MIYLLAGAGVIVSVAFAFVVLFAATTRLEQWTDRPSSRPDPSDASPDPIADLEPVQAIEPVEIVEPVEPVEPVPVPAGLQALAAHSFGSHSFGA